MEFVVSYDFALSRRIPWKGDEASLERHVQAVRTRVASHPTIEGVRAHTDIGTARSSLEFVLLGANRQAVESEARVLMGTAIRDAGAYHQGLFPANEELRMRPRLNSWSGLRTPTWSLRRTAMRLHRRDTSVTAATG